MFAVTDIPDWVMVECGFPYQADIVPSGDQLIKMAAASPSRWIDNVKADVLLLVGSKDLRVPPSQSIYYYKLLKARQVNVKLVYLFVYFC